MSCPVKPDVEAFLTIKVALSLRKYTYSIFTKLLILLIISTLLPLVIYLILSSWYVKKTMSQEFINRNRQEMAMGVGNLKSYINILDYSERSLYYNSSFNSLLSNSNEDHLLKQIANEVTIQQTLRQLAAALPDAQQIHLAAFRLKTSFLHTKNHLKYSGILSYRPTETPEFFYPYFTPPHLLNNYDLDTVAPAPADTMVFSMHLPIYELPSNDKLLAEISIDVPAAVLGNICRSIYKDSEQFYIIDGNRNIYYASDPRLIGTVFAEPWGTDLIHGSSSDNVFVTYDTPQNNVLFCTYLEQKTIKLYLIKSTPYTSMLSASNNMTHMLISLFCIFLIVGIGAMSVSLFQVVRPLRGLTNYIKKVDSGDLETDIAQYVVYKRPDELGILIENVENMMYTINHFIMRQYQIDIATKTTELKMLQAQINPHFLYNMLQCIGTSVLKNGLPDVYESIRILGQLMRYSMDTSKSIIPLSEELQYVENYLYLQRMRFPNRLIVKYTIEKECNSVKVPKMLLQPILENSFKHGKILEKPDGFIEISATVENHFFTISVQDNGIVLSPEVLAALNHHLDQIRKSLSNPASRLAGAGDKLFAKFKTDESIKDNVYTTTCIGISNVYQRLLLHYGKDSKLSLSCNAIGGVTTSMIIPYDQLWEGRDSIESTDCRR